MNNEHIIRIDDKAYKQLKRTCKKLNRKLGEYSSKVLNEHLDRKKRKSLINYNVVE